MTARFLAAATVVWSLTLLPGLTTSSGGLEPLRLDPSGLRWLSLDRPHTAATVLWARNTLSWIGEAPSSAEIEYTVLTVSELDPDWRAPARYGALMLGALGDVDAHERVLKHHAQLHPSDHWFTRALAMSRLLNHQDPQGAAEWLRWASSQPGAPPRLQRLAEALEPAP